MTEIDNSVFVTIDEIEGESYKKDNVSFSCKYGIAGEKALRKHISQSLDGAQIAKIAVKEKFLNPNAFSVGGNIYQRLVSRWGLYKKRNLTPPYNIIKKEKSKSGNFEFVWTAPSYRSIRTK